MNISYSWLKDYVDFDLSAEQLAAALTSIGLECEGIHTVETIRGGLRGIVIGKVLTCVEHPNSDHLHITTVDLGGENPEQIVCGAPNVAAGQTVVVATVGTVLYDGDKEFVIKKSKIRGVESMGMICAEDEIGVGTSHDGIIVITGDNLPAPGTPAAEYYGVQDEDVVEVDITPNRIDAASHYGVARDLAAYLTANCEGFAPVRARRPAVDDFTIDDPSAKCVSVRVDAPQACPRYCGVTIEGVKVAPSPEWLQKRLRLIGLHPINNIVDITNYILHGLGQPLHCFDRAHIDGDAIIVRTCEAGTKFTTLDGVERTLDAADLMICDGNKRPMCIAGVFGGLDSGVTEQTTSVFLESACFNATSVRRTARRHGLSTDASFRYERGLDANGCIYILKVAALMVKTLAGGTIVGEIQDVYPEKVHRPRVLLETEYMDSLIGQKVPSTAVDAILEALEVETLERHGDASNPTSRLLAVPTYRVDVTRPCDVVEDILRIYGYNKIEMPLQVRSSLSYKSTTDAAADMQRVVANQLSGAGFREILNNSLTAVSYYQDDEPERCVRLLNPLSQDLAVMRRTLLYGGLESIEHNVNRKSKDLAMYEFGNVYFYDGSRESTVEAPLRPFSQGARLALWLTGDSRVASWQAPALEASFYDLRAYVDNILRHLGFDVARDIVYAVAEPSKLFAAAMNVATRKGKNLGILGIVSRAACGKCDLKVPVFFAELDWDALTNAAQKLGITYYDLPKTQAVKRDLALLIDTSVTMADIEKVVKDSEKKILRDVTLFDVYEGDKLPEGKKSYAITLTLRDDEKTLQDKYIDNVMNRIIANLRNRLGAELR
ncbi:MAG: phenylalanine--tRNA ligase subunit beta [Bacteroidales bacterium]|nr:phenylalanine--tRNA ligase subunit beta [Bacteroidales bacterium]MDD6960922.1 phenylalanine--tRNA ligase subunit beta [Bacteroidales bacterium]MDY6186673.1 phenylalanine--tRNA ligase subunit beta [Muribaculaceae bacterium]